MKNKTNISYKTWVEKHARARGADAAAELAKLTKKFPEYKNEAQYAKNFPVTHARYQAFLTRGSQAGLRSRAKKSA